MCNFQLVPAIIMVDSARAEFNLSTQLPCEINLKLIMVNPFRPKHKKGCLGLAFNFGSKIVIYCYHQVLHKMLSCELLNL